MAKPQAWVDEQQQIKACTHCGEAKHIAEFYTTGRKVSGEPKYNSWCKACISTKQATYHKRTWGPERLQFTSFKRTKTARDYLAYLRNKAVGRKKGADVISLDALELLWAAQKGHCAVTGWPMTMELGKGRVHTNCSLDRINSALGYEVGNVQLVCRMVNVAKHELSVADFMNLCRAVVEHNNG